jgi:uncharacterized heparinase superfamily protein
VKWTLSENVLETGWQSSLAIQADWLARNLERHLLGNHLFANAKALVFAGLYFEGAAADSWLKTGLDIIEQELPEQVLADGGQFERSPMYHALALEDVVDLLNLAATYPGVVPDVTVASWRETAGRMLSWARVMRHPDGEIALFNDSAFGIAPDPEQLEKYARRLGLEGESVEPGVTYLERTGYVRAENSDAVLFADVGEIGPDYLPGHAHADTLSFELSLFGDRWIVDSGCSTYEVGDERLRQRGTSAHNTVTVDGQDSSEVWSSFRVARRARPGNAAVRDDNGCLKVSASHDGYKRLKGRVIHYRDFELSSDSLSITDRLDGSFTTAHANFLFHPDVTVGQREKGFVLSREGKVAELEFVGGETLLESSTWHPEFGLSLPTQRIIVRLTGSELQTRLTWSRESRD